VGEENFCEEKWGFKRINRSILVFTKREVQITKHGTSEKISKGAIRNWRRREESQDVDAESLKHVPIYDWF